MNPNMRCVLRKKKNLFKKGKEVSEYLEKQVIFKEEK